MRWSFWLIKSTVSSSILSVPRWHIGWKYCVHTWPAQNVFGSNTEGGSVCWGEGHKKIPQGGSCIKGKSPYLFQICKTCDFTYPTSDLGWKMLIEGTLLHTEPMNCFLFLLIIYHTELCYKMANVHFSFDFSKTAFYLFEDKSLVR